MAPVVGLDLAWQGIIWVLASRQHLSDVGVSLRGYIDELCHIS